MNFHYSDFLESTVPNSYISYGLDIEVVFFLNQADVSWYLKKKHQTTLLLVYITFLDII